MLQGTQPRASNRRRPQAEAALEQSKTQMAQLADEMLSRASNPQPRDSQTGSNRFKNQYLSSYNSVASNRKPNEATADQDQALSDGKGLSYGPEEPADGVSSMSSKRQAQGPQPSTSNPYLGRYLGGSRGRPREAPETPHLGQAEPRHSFQDT